MNANTKMLAIIGLVASAYFYMQSQAQAKQILAQQQQIIAQNNANKQQTSDPILTILKAIGL
jgi:hypothetical protein